MKWSVLCAANLPNSSQQAEANMTETVLNPLDSDVIFAIFLFVEFGFYLQP